MIVMGTSALVEFLVGSDTVAEQVRDFASTSRLAAPHGVDLECASTLRGLVLGSKLPADEAKRALTILRRMRLRRHDAAPLLPRIWQLRANMWPYDAAFAALAEALDVPLLTVDGKFQRTPGLRCHVHYVADDAS